MTGDLRRNIALVEAAMGDDLPVGFRAIKNPSKTALAAALRNTKVRSEGLRALIADNGDLFAWDSYYANHDEAERALGLSNTVSLHLYSAHPELDADTLDTSDEDDLQHLRALCKRMLDNPHLQRLYGSGFDFQVEIGYDTQWASSLIRA